MYKLFVYILTIIYSSSKLIWDHPLNNFICTVCTYNARKDWLNVPETPDRPIPLYQAKINQKTGRRLKFTTHTRFFPVYIIITVVQEVVFKPPVELFFERLKKMYLWTQFN